MEEGEDRRYYDGGEKIDMRERVERQPAHPQRGVVAESQRDETVHHLVQNDREDRRQRPDRYGGPEVAGVIQAEGPRRRRRGGRAGGKGGDPCPGGVSVGGCRFSASRRWCRRGSPVPARD